MLVFSFLLLSYTSFLLASIHFRSLQTDSDSFISNYDEQDEDAWLLIAHLQSEVFSQQSSLNYECGLVRQRVWLSEMQRTLAAQLDAGYVRVVPFTKSHLVERVSTPNLYMMLPPSHTSFFEDQDKSAYRASSSTFHFYAIDPKWYDGYAYFLIPTKAIYAVNVGTLGKPKPFSPATVAAVMKERERIIQERFCPPASLPRASKQPTVPFQLTLPTSKDALFYPDTFRDPLWDLGDVVKMLFLVAIRDGVSFHELVRQRALASFGLFPSKGCLSSLFKSGSGEVSDS